VPRLTRKLTSDLAIGMTAFGVLVGALFPVFAVSLGVDPEAAYSTRFVVATLGAGLIVGLFNFLIARLMIAPRLSLLADSMQRINRGLLRAEADQDANACRLENCRVEVDSVDELGSCADAFNSLVETLFHQQQLDRVVRQFSQATSTQLDLGNLSRQSLGFFFEHTEAVAGGLFVTDGGRLRVVSSVGLRDPARIAENPRLQRILSDGHRVLLRLPEAVRVDGLLADFQPVEVLAMPVGFAGDPLGVIVLAADRPFAGESLGQLELLIRVLGLALNNAMAHQQLERLAALDSLTGLYNRRFGLARLDEELSRARRSAACLGLIMLDIDHFKRVNDRRGHLAGDRVIRMVAQTVAGRIRQGDVAVRYGGEEFLVVLPGADLGFTGQVAERIRAGVAAQACVHDGGEIRVTVSLGVAALPEVTADRAQQLIQAADQALYRAKAGGRDRVETGT
jgi:two-component system cell cycle response regulator